MALTQKTIVGNIASTLQPDEKFGDSYVLRKLLGQGGMGQVWLADEVLTQNDDEQILRQVCIKIVPPEIQRSGDEMQRVKDIFQKTHILHHSNICPIHDLKFDSRHGFYLVMKYIDGQPFDKVRHNLLQRNGKITVDDAVKYLFPIAGALDYAHRNKIIHRDIKPDNILIDESDSPIIIDFGLAAQFHNSMTRVSQAVTSKSGTLIYKAPEQWRGELQDHQTDQYSLGVVAYEFLSGRVPFIADDVDLLGHHVRQIPVPKVSELPDNVNDVLVKVLAKERKNRYENCIEFVKALKESTQKKIKPYENNVEIKYNKVSNESINNAKTNDEKETNTSNKLKSITDAKRWNELLDAVTKNNLSNVQYLVHGLDINSRYNGMNMDGFTLLHIAVYYNADIDIVKYLVSKGIDVNTKDNKGCTPLHWAAGYNVNIEVLEYLVSQGADVNAKNYIGETPLHYAALNNNNVTFLI
ncbi:MAG: protein kinase, partial [Planctomycetaceae bacterium]|nr:protein kinase [Planctomycetaceae bacterium]